MRKPSVGIWWFYYDAVLFCDPVEVEDGLTYGDCITGLTDHAEFWDILEADGRLAELPHYFVLNIFIYPVDVSFFIRILVVLQFFTAALRKLN